MQDEGIIIYSIIHNHIDNSKNAVFDNKKAVRGGIPIVFRKLYSKLYSTS